MINTLDRLLRSNHLHKYRKLLLYVAGTLLVLHVAAIVLPFLPGKHDWVDPLTENSGNLLGVTGTLIALVVLDRAVRALSDVEKRRQREVYSFIQTRLEEWFNQDPDLGPSSILERVVDKSFTHFKVQGDPERIRTVDAAIASKFCEEVHFEFTFYPTKVIYGIHCESPSEKVNSVMCDRVRSCLRLDDKTGFVRDAEIPKKPGWVFLIRSVAVSEGLESDLPETMTHARHYVELVGHSYALLYSEDMARDYQDALRVTAA